MLGKLKTLPLTILLTILIWMYAEAQFTASRDDVRISLKVTPPEGVAVRLLDSNGAPMGNVASILVTLQGAKSEIDRIFQQSQGQTSSDDELASLTYKLQKADVNPLEAR